VPRRAYRTVEPRLIAECLSAAAARGLDTKDAIGQIDHLRHLVAGRPDVIWRLASTAQLYMERINFHLSPAGRAELARAQVAVAAELKDRW
jgi:hypothetical protein